MKEQVEKIIAWIQDYFKKNGPDAKAIIGISGGTDSSVCAALLAKALGKDRVVGVMLPNGNQHDIDVSHKLIEHLGISSLLINIKDSVEGLRKEFSNVFGCDPNDVDAYKSNTPARIRMTALYGVSALLKGRVCNTCNLSEDYVGYSTKFGDAAGDFSLLNSFTKTEVRAIGRELGLPSLFVDKIPEDGMSGKSDEEKLGFTYEVLDHYLTTGEIENNETKEKIERLHKMNLHKLLPMPAYQKEEE